MDDSRRFTGRQITTMVVAVCAAVILLPAGVYAATGGTFLLGKSNSAGHTTALKNTGTGSALSLTAAKSSTPVLSVGTNKTRIPNLNADLLDGLHGTSYQRRVTKSCGAASAVASVSSSGGVGCHGTVVGYATPGTYHYVTPAGVTAVVVEIWGAGGGGAGSTINCSAPAGGGQGAYERVLVPVTPGTSYTVVVGSGGAGGTVTDTCGDSGSGGAGGASEFTAADQAGGGSGGTTCATGCGVGGAGGQPTVGSGAGITATPGASGQDSGGGGVDGGGAAGFVGSGGASHTILGSQPGDPGVGGLVLVEPA